MKSLCFAAILLVTGSAFGQSAYQFLNLDVSAKEAALSGSALARIDDPSAFYYNPALSVASGNRAVTFGFLKHVLDINGGYVFSTFQIPKEGYFGVGIGYLDYGSFAETDQAGNQIGTFGAGDAVLTLNYANYLGKNFSYGINLKGIYSSIASYNSSAVAIDAGLYYNFPDELLGVGVSVVNAGQQISTYDGIKEPLPFDFRIGVTKQLEHLPLILNVALQRLGDPTLSLPEKLRSFVIGGEFLLSKNFHVLIGYNNLEHQQMKIGLNSGIEGLSFGVGVKFLGYAFDYSYSSWGARIGGLHRINVTTSF